MSYVLTSCTFKMYDKYIKRERKIDMANTNMNIRMDSDIKKQAQELFSSLGMDMTTAINVFLIQAVQCQGLPFEIKRRVPNAETLAAMEAVKRDKDIHGPFDSVEDLMADLNS